jgi:hypothetical protein
MTAYLFNKELWKYFIGEYGLVLKMWAIKLTKWK